MEVVCEERLKIIYRKGDMNAFEISILCNPNGLIPVLLQLCNRGRIFAPSIPHALLMLHCSCYRLFLLSVTQSLR